MPPRVLFGPFAALGEATVTSNRETVSGPGGQ